MGKCARPAMGTGQPVLMLLLLVLIAGLCNAVDRSHLMSYNAPLFMDGDELENPTEAPHHSCKAVHMQHFGRHGSRYVRSTMVPPPSRAKEEHRSCSSVVSDRQ